MTYESDDKSATPAVSIVTPFFNVGQVFRETARTVFQQSFQQWEWLIVNDGSTNQEALDILDNHRELDPRIRVIDHKTNRGLSAARNTGYRAAATDYVVQLDGDDLLEPTAIEKWFWFLESFPEYAFCKGYSVGFGAEEYLWERGFHSRRMFLVANQIDPTSIVRKSVHAKVGGFDEDNRHGLEDWEFWMRCANAGYWGASIPEYLNWYRRRPQHTSRWNNWDGGPSERLFRERLREKYPGLWNGGFPDVQPRWHMPNESLPDHIPATNRLKKDRPRLLMLLPWLTLGGADKFNLDVVKQFCARDWDITVATTLPGDQGWFHEFEQYTEEIFVLERFLRLIDYPRFLRYLIASRQIDTVLISHSELGYLLLPYLRTHFPDVTFVDYCHIEEEDWKNGGYPRLAVEYQHALDLNIVSSEHLRNWMVARGADRDRIKVCYTNIDASEWQPDARQRQAVRDELQLDESTPAILYTGRICAQKQPRVFANAMRELRDLGASFVAFVAGDGPDFDWLRGFVDKHDLTAQVRLLGSVPNERIKQLMTAADILFLPSKWEGIALTVYEAMSCGLPIVGADVGGQRELVTPECGVLTARTDETTEAHQYALLLNDLVRDAHRQRTMGRNGRERIESHFQLSRMGERMCELLRLARNMNAGEPRHIPDVGLGRACAAQAIEYVRLFRLSDQLWAERHKGEKRVGLYLFLERWLGPVQRWGISHRMTWLGPLGNKLKQLLLRRELSRV